VKRYIQNFELVRQKMKDLEERDTIRNFQPCITGDDITQIFNIRPSKEVGTIKTAIKDAILDGIIPNEYNAAYTFMVERAKELGLTPKKEQEGV
jgi:poly(A) polymerase